MSSRPADHGPPRTGPDNARTGTEHSPSGPTTADMAPLVRTALRGKSTRSYWLGLVIGVVLAAATALLVVQNPRSTRLTWLGWDFSAPLWLILLLAVAAGAVLLALSGLFIAHTRSRNESGKAARQRLKRLTTESPPSD